jgi:hypothetical protein
MFFFISVSSVLYKKNYALSSWIKFAIFYFNLELECLAYITVSVRWGTFRIEDNLLCTLCSTEPLYIFMICGGRILVVHRNPSE